MFKQGLFSFVVRFLDIKIFIFLKHYINVHISFISDQILDISTPHRNLPLFQQVCKGFVFIIIIEMVKSTLEFGQVSILLQYNGIPMLLCDLQKYNGSLILLSNPPLLITLHLMDVSIRLLPSSITMFEQRVTPCTLGPDKVVLLDYRMTYNMKIINQNRKELVVEEEMFGIIQTKLKHNKD